MHQCKSTGEVHTGVPTSCDCMACNKMTEDKRWLHPRNKLRFLLFGCSPETVRTMLDLDQQNLPRRSDGDSTREQSAAEAAQAIDHAKLFAEASIAGARNCSNGRQTRNSKPRNFGTTSGEPLPAKVPDIVEMLVSGSSPNSPCWLVDSTPAWYPVFWIFSYLDSTHSRTVAASSAAACANRSSC